MFKLELEVDDAEEDHERKDLSMSPACLEQYAEIYNDNEIICTSSNFDNNTFAEQDSVSLSDDFFQSIMTHNMQPIAEDPEPSVPVTLPALGVLSEDGINDMFHDNLVVTKKAKILKSQQFDKAEYQLLPVVLGKGSYSNVKLCFEGKEQRYYAAKIIVHYKLKRIPMGYKDVDNELAILRKLRDLHLLKGATSRDIGERNVIEFKESIFDKNKKKYYIILEYCLGSIHDLMEAKADIKFTPLSKALPDDQTHLYFVQTLHGLAFLHSQSIYHLDLKPGNLLLTSRHSVRITDFGVSHIATESTRCNNDQGEDALIFNCRSTPVIQPPEVTKPRPGPYSCAKIDMYCMGFCLYYMLCGKVPFDDDVVFRIFEIISRGVYEIPDHVSEHAGKAISLLLAKEPQERPHLRDVWTFAWVARPCSRSRENFVGLDLLRDESMMEVLPFVMNDEGDDSPEPAPIFLQVPASSSSLVAPGLESGGTKKKSKKCILL